MLDKKVVDLTVREALHVGFIWSIATITCRVAAARYLRHVKKPKNTNEEYLQYLREKRSQKKQSL